MAPFDEMGWDGVEENLAEDSAVDFGANVLRALGRQRGILGAVAARGTVAEVELSGGVVDSELFAFGTAVLVERFLKPVLAESTLAVLPAEVEGASEVSASVEACFTLIECGRDITAVEGEEECKAAETAANDDGAR